MIESKRTIMLLLAMIGVLALLLGVLMILPQAASYNAQQDEISIFSYPTSEVARIDITRKDRVYTMLQDETGWHSQDGTELDYGSADLLVTFLSYLYSDNLVEAHAKDLGIYDLETPGDIAVFYLVDQTHHTVSFGAETVNGKSVYMRVDDADTVYTISWDAHDIIFSTIPKAGASEE